ncbi:hypothetical protein [Kamese virus]|uniref:UN1 n=1 Tax=Kamese virus TaxID=200402 RepID=A0A0D3R1F5_9RHAB|nr:hypothetical protein [Kamese virus]AJR28332.1 hypothetical protein [Kamese virus]ARE72405.1 UN1 [Kamese virus]
MKLFINAGLTFNYYLPELPKDVLHEIISIMITRCVTMSGFPEDLAAFAVNWTWEQTQLCYYDFDVSHGYSWIQDDIELPGDIKSDQPVLKEYRIRTEFPIGIDRNTGEVEFFIYINTQINRDAPHWSSVWWPKLMDPLANYLFRNPDQVASKYGFLHMLYT